MKYRFIFINATYTYRGFKESKLALAPLSARRAVVQDFTNAFSAADFDCLCPIAGFILLSLLIYFSTDTCSDIARDSRKSRKHGSRVFRVF